MHAFEKICAAAAVVGGLALGAGAAGATPGIALAPAEPSSVDDVQTGSTAGLPSLLNSGVPDLGSSAGSVGAFPALGSFSADLGLCGLTTVSSIPICPQ
ncbi:hypothetical protein A5780_35690 [Nocardia sp. 852002-20019_SCH5090214]|jgi:hypothetical protein|uniref:hypothetical protein n=1 Tax=Nocardia TaxID=1817 RepID=UPI0007E95454|nr:MULTISPECIES: hypothetical protein [Nocardia]MBV7706250.1 hypothetical protein [Nocardia nova]OBA45668.1 hypothetical protein A5780_35690 [Nocardia sp. 852002-20019_SCH5090214]PPI96612.1 hypothetical protein C5E46_17730 [Nocardia nova]